MKVSHLKVVTLCQTKISIQEIIEILEARLTATKLIEIRWGHLDLGGDRRFATEGTPEEWQQLEKLMSRPTHVIYNTAKQFRELPEDPLDL